MKINLNVVTSKKVYDCYCSVAQLRVTLCDPMDCSTPDFAIFQYLLEFAHTHVY